MPKKVQQPKIIPLENREDQQLKSLIDHRRKYFSELLGNDCPYLDALIANQDIDRSDVVNLLERGCPVAIIPKILL